MIMRSSYVTMNYYYYMYNPQKFERSSAVSLLHRRYKAWASPSATRYGNIAILGKVIFAIRLYYFVS